MPYIKKEDRDRIYQLLSDKRGVLKKAINIEEINNAGDLQYAIAILIRSAMESKTKVNYQFMNDIMGALTGAQLEFYRKVVAPYEDKKIDENGGVYKK